MKTLALTGGTGFVGRAIADAAAKAGYAVRLLVRDPSRVAPREAMLVMPWDAETGEGSLRALDGVDILCHAAAFIPKDMRDATQAERCLRVNALGTLGLLGAAERAGLKRFVHLSTGNAYRFADHPVAEDTPLYPSERAPFYLASKLVAEIYVDHWRTARGLSSCTLRLSSVYGPGMADKGLVPNIANKLRSGQHVTLTNEGRFAADLIFIDDVVQCALVAISGAAEGAVNVGTGVATSARDVAQTLVSLLGADESLLLYAQSENSDLGFAPLDTQRARALLGLRPRSLRDGLSAYLGWLSRR